MAHHLARTHVEVREVSSHNGEWDPSRLRQHRDMESQQSNSWHVVVKKWVVKAAAHFLGISAQQGSVAILHAATAPTCGPDPKVQGVGDDEGRGGGRYFNRIWEQEPAPYCKDPDAKHRVWRKVNDVLKLKEKGLLAVLGLSSLE